MFFSMLVQPWIKLLPTSVIDKGLLRRAHGCDRPAGQPLSHFDFITDPQYGAAGPCACILAEHRLVYVINQRLFTNEAHRRR